MCARRQDQVVIGHGSTVHEHPLFLHIHAGHFGHQHFRVLLFPEHLPDGRSDVVWG